MKGESSYISRRSFNREKYIQTKLCFYFENVWDLDSKIRSSIKGRALITTKLGSYKVSQIMFINKEAVPKKLKKTGGNTSVAIFSR